MFRYKKLYKEAVNKFKELQKENHKTISNNEALLRKISEYSDQIDTIKTQKEENTNLKKEIKELKSKLREQSRADIITSSIDIIIDQLKPPEKKKTLGELQNQQKAAQQQYQAYGGNCNQNISGYLGQAALANN